ncbi:MAG: NAD-dependent epimerase/dehydratase family protein [Kaiparowitsia implicata GSE-PSE-MK54-09C]|jgi:nucleoside-diphosphate-sugar epimerase|nr:NAD-dependent epimerase/dehydratase family protein [Kaiparowitsia implicata GSE-PSE-MK54-09C]
MKALVTGATGFTGSHLVRALLQQGHEVMALVRESSDRTRLAGLPVQLAYGDITDTAAVKAAIAGVDWVFHTAAYVELGIVDAERMRRVNVEGTRNVLEGAIAANVQKMLYCSTIGIYGDTQGQIIDETFERAQKGFSSAYDVTKYEAQQLVDQAASSGFPVVSLMPSGIFGADDPHFGPVLHSFRQGKLKVWAGGDRVTGIVHVDDLVELMLLAIEKAPPGQHYIASAGEMTTHQMFQIVSSQAGVPMPTEMPKPLVRFIGALLDPIGRLVGWQPPISRERVHYLYDRCVRVDGSKAMRDLDWTPRSPEAVIRELAV